MRNSCALLIASVAFFIAGCSHSNPKLGTALGLRPVLATNHVPEMTVTNVVFTTNIITTVAKADEAGNIVAPSREIEMIQPIVQVTTTPAHSQVVTNGWEKNPLVYETANAIGATIPGWGTLGAGLFGALGSIAAAWQTAAARKANGRADATEQGLVGTIDGIEQIRLALQQTEKGRELDAKVVEALKTAQANAGAVDLVQKLIEIHTGYTKQQVDLSKILADPKA